MSDALQSGDVVFVIGRDENFVGQREILPGSVGEVMHICYCCAVCNVHGYKVAFGSREACFRRKHLRKLEPPNEPETVKQEREVPA